MTDADIQTVKNTYTQIQNAGNSLGNYFYNRISDIAEELDPLFTEDKANNGAGFAALLDKAVQSIDNPEALLPEIKKMEAKMKYYNVEDDCLSSVGVVFIDTLSFGFGKNFTPPVMDPWVAAFKMYAALFFQD